MNYPRLLIFTLSLASLTASIVYSSSITSSNRITVTNDTFKTLILYFDSMIYKRPQIERLIPKQTRSIFLEDYSDKDITKNITIEVRGATGEPTTWAFSQTALSANIKLIFSKTGDRPLRLTIIKPSGATRIVDPISR